MQIQMNWNFLALCFFPFFFFFRFHSNQLIIIRTEVAELTAVRRSKRELKKVFAHMFMTFFY